MFKILHRDGLARTGILRTAHGEIRTPAFIPVATKAAIKGLSTKQLDEIGFDSLLSNTYHLYLRPGSKTVKKLGGLHGFMNYQKPIFTDSGGFQVFSLKKTEVDDEGVKFYSHIDDSEHYFTPEISMQVQTDLGADIIFTFDHCIHFDDDYETTQSAMDRTHKWTERCVKEFKKLHGSKEGKEAIDGKESKKGIPKQFLFGIVQGGRFKELREKSAKFITKLNFPGYGIGGIFGDPTKEIHGVVKHTMQFLDEGKPKHMLGIGSVEDLFDYVGVGADTFDCVLPTRLARLGYVFIPPKSGGNVGNKFRMRITSEIYRGDGTPVDENCQCYVCKTYSKAYLRHLFKAKELLFYSLTTYHNLYFFHSLMDKIRTSIGDGKFEELKREWVN
jgi:queuine tRNA-ribosyltransferase